MSAIVQATTPTLTLLVPGVDLSEANSVEVYVSTDNVLLRFTTEDRVERNI